MKDLIEEILEYARGMWRFRWQAFGISWVICALGWLLVATLPNVYEASARVYVDASTQLKPLLQGLTVDTDVDAQLNLVRQELLSTSNLDRVARISLPDARMDTPAVTEGVINSLRKRITIIVDRGPERSQDKLYSISFRDSRSDRSLKIVKSLLSTFVSNSRDSDHSGSVVAQRFLTDQIRDYDRRLGESEQRLADFKKNHAGLVPGQAGDYFTRVQNETDALRLAQSQLEVLEGQRDELRRQLRGEAPLVPMAGGVQPARGSLDIDTRLRESESRLDELLLRYTDKHPEVIALRETIAELKARRASDIAALARGDDNSGGINVAANPIYQNIQIQLNKVEVDSAALRREISNRQKSISELRTLINTAPDVEAQLARLNRDYGITKTQYDALVDRLEKARLSELAGETGVVNFQIIDPPAVSLTPVAPNRHLLFAVVLLAGIGVGAGFAYLRSQMQPVITGVRSLAEISGRPVLATIGLMWSDARSRDDRVRTWRFASAAATLVVGFLATLALEPHLVALLHPGGH